ncbi:MAG: 2-hydroxyacyl-CoA dehydratase [Deltaproteobacteria bacterium]|nr:2-hydroxyacyl-CoA dehydratase [Deltaproteobacteria bacterium]MBW1816469.1 2-hydroxyacyl-CoA dehydratase [Deltaproteobacteria bacterium]MBW2283223.1 2-hydroxyacyl-CoA dehydratase [Deltaproteobacteria bacterium]
MIDAFAQFNEDRHQAIKKYKEKTGKKVFGYFCCLSPEEILFAADVLPIRITGTGEPLQHADLHVPPNSCPFARSCLDAGMRGLYDYLDGVLIPNSCDIIFSMEYLWKELVPRPTPPAIISGVDIKPFVHYINYPEKINSPEVMPYYTTILQTFRQDLERTLNRTITDDDLSAAVTAYNEDKVQMKRMYDMRKTDPPAVSGYEAWQAAYASVSMPRDEHAALLKDWLDEIEQSGRRAEEGVRIYLSGSAMDHINAHIFKVIEACGGQVVSDDLCVGTRTFWYPLNLDLPPLEAIARRSLGTACPRSTVTAHIPENRWAHIKNTTAGFDLEGAIFYVLKCCDARLSEFPHLRDKLRQELDMPILFLEGDYTIEGVEQMTGRVEAFLEMIEG